MVVSILAVHPLNLHVMENVVTTQLAVVHILLNAGEQILPFHTILICRLLMTTGSL